jgi:hypothetical protein
MSASNRKRKKKTAVLASDVRLPVDPELDQVLAALNMPATLIADMILWMCETEHFPVTADQPAALPWSPPPKGGLAVGTALLACDRRGSKLRTQMLLYPMLEEGDSTTSIQQYEGLGAWDRGSNRAVVLTFPSTPYPGGRSHDPDTGDLAAHPFAFSRSSG